MSTIISGPGLDPSAPAAPAAESRNIENPNVPITASQLADILGGGSTGSGQIVNERTSLRIAAVYACVRVISDAIARMPLIVYELTNTGRNRAKRHPLYGRLKVRPNDDMSSFSWRKAMMANVLLRGNGYSEIVRRGDGRPDAIYPIESSRVRPFRTGGELRYEVTREDGERVTLLRRDVIHLPGLSFDGICGISVVANARRTLGAAMASDEFQDTMLGNALRPSGVLEHPGKLGPAGVSTLRESLERLYSGPKSAGKPMVLEEGMKWHQTTMTLEDAQFVESTYLRIEDICRWFGVQPHKIMHLLRSTNNNIEAQGLDFLGDTLSPWVEAFEQEINWKLFLPEEQDRYYAEHLTQSIVQMDSNTRGQMYERLFRIGAISPDEIRERENMNFVEGDRGKGHWIQGSNMPLPTPEQRDQLIESWIKKGAGSSASPPDNGGDPAPKQDGKVAGNT